MNSSSEPTKFLLLFYTSAKNKGLYYNIFIGSFLWADDALVLLSERPEGRVSLYLSEDILVWNHVFLCNSPRTGLLNEEPALIVATRRRTQYLKDRDYFWV
jgi:hypothetical protein